MKWGDSARDSDSILAVWPTYNPLLDWWPLFELADNGVDAVSSRARRIPADDGHVKLDVHFSEDAAKAAANAANIKCREHIASIYVDDAKKTSMRLKAEKMIQAKERLLDEEKLMQSVAVHRGKAEGIFDPSNLVLSAESSDYRLELEAQLNEMPYLPVALVGDRGQKKILYMEKDGSWSRPYPASLRSATMAIRARTAVPFKISPNFHWGKTKARIRKILLPRANQLLQLASVRKILDESLAKGQKVIVCNGYVFWYEEDKSIGWQVKEVASTPSGDGEALWLEGTIVSTNHGRIVVLPFIKENGEHVRGHTKNAPNDGKALPRHPDQFVEIPFVLYEGDLMIGLFGDLPYE